MGTAEALIAELEARFGARDPDFDLAAYRARNPDLAALFAEEWEYVAHYLQHGREERRDAPTDLAKVEAYHARRIARLSALAAVPSDATRLDIARSLILNSRGIEARAILETLDRPGAGTLRELSHFVDRFSVARAGELLIEIRGRHGNLHTSDLADLILRAKAEARPFSLLRLGAAEGAFLQIGAEDEARHTALYAAIRADWVRRLADASGAMEDADVIGDALGCAAAGADALGIPQDGWIAHEYATGDPGGIVGLVTVLRWVLRHPLHLSRSAFVGHGVNQELAAAGFLDRLLTGTRFGLVASDPTLVAQAGWRFEDAEIDVYPGLPASVGCGQDEAAYLIARLDGSLNGRVFLVADDVRAKAAIHLIRERGGIAIDVGSNAADWLTRPTT